MYEKDVKRKKVFCWWPMRLGFWSEWLGISDYVVINAGDLTVFARGHGVSAEIIGRCTTLLLKYEYEIQQQWYDSYEAKHLVKKFFHLHWHVHSSAEKDPESRAGLGGDRKFSHSLCVALAIDSFTVGSQKYTPSIWFLLPYSNYLSRRILYPRQCCDWKRFPNSFVQENTSTGRLQSDCRRENDMCLITYIIQVVTYESRYIRIRPNSLE